MHSLRRWIIVVGASFAAAAAAYSYAQHLEYVKMHTMPPGLQAFDVNGPIPTCGRWKDTMPKTRDAAAYRRYINARKHRYDQISDALDLNHDMKMARLDQVLPLPPAELPRWQGVQDAIESEPDGPLTY